MSGKFNITRDVSEEGATQDISDNEACKNISNAQAIENIRDKGRNENISDELAKSTASSTWRRELCMREAASMSHALTGCWACAWNREQEPILDLTSVVSTGLKILADMGQFAVHGLLTAYLHFMTIMVIMLTFTSAHSIASKASIASATLRSS